MKVFSLYRFTLKIRAMQTLQFHHHHKVDTQITTRFLKEYLSEEKSITNQILKTSALFHGQPHPRTLPQTPPGCVFPTASAKLSGLTHAAVALCATETNEAEGWLLSEPMEVQCFHFVQLKRLHNQIHYFRHFQDSRNIPIFSILLSRPVGTTNNTNIVYHSVPAHLGCALWVSCSGFRGGWLAQLQTHCYDLTAASLLSDTALQLRHKPHSSTTTM